MRRFAILDLTLLSLVGIIFAVASTTAGAKGIKKQQLVGTWTLAATDNTKADGSKVDQFGSNPKGILIFDRAGHYSLTIVRSDLPKFAAGTSDHGTAAENQAVLAGMIASFGTYSLNEADGTLTTQVEGSSFPNLAGGGQKRVISSLTASELKYTNTNTSTGLKADVTWKRVK